MANQFNGYVDVTSPGLQAFFQGRALKQQRERTAAEMEMHAAELEQRGKIAKQMADLRQQEIDNQAAHNKAALDLQAALLKVNQAHQDVTNKHSALMAVRQGAIQAPPTPMQSNPDPTASFPNQGGLAGTSQLDPGFDSPNAPTRPFGPQLSPSGGQDVSQWGQGAAPIQQVPGSEDDMVNIGGVPVRRGDLPASTMTEDRNELAQKAAEFKAWLQDQSEAQRKEIEKMREEAEKAKYTYQEGGKNTRAVLAGNRADAKETKKQEDVTKTGQLIADTVAQNPEMADKLVKGKYIGPTLEALAKVKNIPQTAKQVDTWKTLGATVPLIENAAEFADLWKNGNFTGAIAAYNRMRGMIMTDPLLKNTSLARLSDKDMEIVSNTLPSYFTQFLGIITPNTKGADPTDRLVLGLMNAQARGIRSATSTLTPEQTQKMADVYQIRPKIGSRYHQLYRQMYGGN